MNKILKGHIGLEVHVYILLFELVPEASRGEREEEAAAGARSNLRQVWSWRNTLIKTNFGKGQITEDQEFLNKFLLHLSFPISLADQYIIRKDSLGLI